MSYDYGPVNEYPPPFPSLLVFDAQVTELEGSAERARNTLETVEKTMDQDVRLDDA